MDHVLALLVKLSWTGLYVIGGSVAVVCLVILGRWLYRIAKALMVFAAFMVAVTVILASEGGREVLATMLGLLIVLLDTITSVMILRVGVDLILFFIAWATIFLCSYYLVVSICKRFMPELLDREERGEEQRIWESPSIIFQSLYWCTGFALIVTAARWWDW